MWQTERREKGKGNGGDRAGERGEGEREIEKARGRNLGKGFEGERKMGSTKEGDVEESDERRQGETEDRAGAVGKRLGELLWECYGEERDGGQREGEGREAGRERARGPKYLQGGGVTGR